jgi:putative membrane protein
MHKDRGGKAMNTRIIKIAHVVAVIVILLVAAVVMGVARQGESSVGQNSNQSGGGAASSVSNADRKFAMTAAMDGMAEVELGRLATERGASDAVKQFGQRMVDDHSKANDELKQWAATAGVTLPTALDAKHRAVVSKMSGLSGAAFDRAYAKEMVKDHTKAVQLFQRESERGADAGLKSFAAATLPTLREHLQMARSLNTGGGGHNMSGNAPSGSGTNNANANRR